MTFQTNNRLVKPFFKINLYICKKLWYKIFNPAVPAMLHCRFWANTFFWGSFVRNSDAIGLSQGEADGREPNLLLQVQNFAAHDMAGLFVLNSLILSLNILDRAN